ncbi:MAG: ATP-binding cassette domain-containing protein, partial [Clostridia bacterium]
VKYIGVVFGQRSQLWWDVPVIDSFELLKDIYKIPEKEYNETLNELIETLNLKELLNRPLRQLSLGQKMKCELAGSLLHRPKLLFLDEPTIGLDAVTKLSVRKFIKDINTRWGTTIILTTHDMSDIEALTNKIILIGRGQILYNGSFSSIKHKYDSIKQIEVEFKHEYETIKLDNYEVISHNKNMAVLKNKPEISFNTKDFVNEISKNYEIVDFSVKSISVDEILAKLYTELDL